MRIWDSIRRLSSLTFRKNTSALSSLGFLKNKKTENRRLQIEQFEDRILLSINSPELNAIFINQDQSQYFDPASTNQVYHIAPNSLLLRFNEGQQLNPDTLKNGIEVVRAGADGQFGTADDVIVGIGWVGLNGSQGDGKDIDTVSGKLKDGIVGNEVIIRFADNLPDDQYQIRLIGTGTTPLKNLQGDVFHDNKDQTVSFELDLGAQVVSVVPQPITRNETTGKLTQARNQIELYFNANDPLYFPGFDHTKTGEIDKTFTTTTTNYLKLFQLIATNDTANSADDTIYLPTRIEYSPKTGKMVLTFANELDKLPAFANNPSAARLRVGTPYAKTQTNILDLNVSGSPDPGDSFHTSFDLKSYFNTASTITAPQSLVIHGQISPKYDPMEYPGAGDNPGSRNLPLWLDTLTSESHYNDESFSDSINGLKDQTDGPGIIYYNFRTILGHDATGKLYNNEITEAQKDLTRQIFQLYSRYLGVQFIEDTDMVNPKGITIATGDIAVLNRVTGAENYLPKYTQFSSEPNYTSVVGGILGLGGYGSFAILDKSENWGPDVYGGAWFTVAMHNIGHALGFGHAADLPTGTVMGATRLIGGRIESISLVPGIDGANIYGERIDETTFPGDYDILHGQYMYRPDSIDVDLYRFEVEQRGMFNAEIYAQRENAASLLDATLTLYRLVTTKDGTIYYEMISRNDDYFGKDSFLEMYLTPGTYFIGVAASGNNQYNPDLENTGEGGKSAGNYELRMNFTPGGVDPGDITTFKDVKSTTCLVDVTGVKFDGDHNGTPGGEYNYWFNVQTQAKTIYVDKVAASGGNGTIDRPYNTIQAALNAAKEGDIVRIVGNNFENDATNLLDNVAYEIGKNGSTVLSDGATFDVPRGVTVMIDAGAVLKFANANINVGSYAEGIDRSGGTIQVLGTPFTNVYFTSYFDQTIGTKTNPNNTTPIQGQWGGISIRNDLDYEFINSYTPASNRKQREVLEEQGIFLNYINHATLRYGGGGAEGLVGFYTPINLNASQATVSYNTITHSRNAAISADLSSFEETRFQSWDHDKNTIFTLDYTRIGPNVYGNTVTDNAVNGLAVRARAVADPTSTLQKVTGNIRFSALDIVYVLQENIIIQGTTGEYYTSTVTAPGLRTDFLQYRAYQNLAFQMIPGYHTLGGNADNDRLYDSNLFFNSYTDSNGVTHRVPADGEYFSLSDGTTTLVFEFHHTHDLSGRPNPVLNVRQGRVQIDINPTTDTIASVMQKLRDIINSFSAADYLVNYQKYIPSGGNQLVKPFKITAAINSTLGNNVLGLSSKGTELEIAGTGLVKANEAGRLMVDPGAVLKFLNTRIEVEMGGQFLAEGTTAYPIIMTSLYDNRYGAGGTYATSTNRPAGNNSLYLPKGGDWSGIYFGPDSSGSLDHIVLAFGGGSSAAVEQVNTGFNAVEIHQADVRIVNSRFEYNAGVVRGDSYTMPGQVGRGSATPAVIFVRSSQPIIVNNEFFNNDNTNKNTNSLAYTANALAVISINANSLNDQSVIDWGRSTGPVDNYSDYNDNYGPLVRDNRMTGNSVNGMVVRGEILTVAGIWDDADIVHVLYNEIKIPNYQHKGGLRLMSAPEQSLILKLFGPFAGFTTMGTPMENDTRIGGALQIVGIPGYPVVLTSLKDDSVGAGRNLKGQVMFDTVNDYDPVTGKSKSQPAPGDWRSIKLDSYSNDRNVMVVTEWEKGANTEDQNGSTKTAQYLGRLATGEKGGDDVYHLGYEILGAIRSDKPNESDVYSFTATPGTEIWLDIINTARDLDLILEVLDAEGKILARSDNAYLEERGYPDYEDADGLARVESYDGTNAYTLNKDRWHRSHDYSINQRDPGLRFIVPGKAGDKEKLYYVRVRSSLGITDVQNVTQANSNGKTFTVSKTNEDNTTTLLSFVFDFARDTSDASYLAGLPVSGNFIIPMKGVASTEEAKQKAIIDAINKANQSAVTARLAYYYSGEYDVRGEPVILSHIVLDGVDLVFDAKATGLTRLANTSGNYTLQVRLQETYEVPGCAVTYADIRYSTNGIEAYGFPQNALNQADFINNMSGNTFDAAMDLGNLLGSSSGAISVSGYLTNLNQVDWYRFSLNYRGTEYIPGLSTEANIWSAIFDIDYADGLNRPDLTLWVFDSGGRLIYIGNDSNVADDQYDPNLSTSIEKLSAGTAGPYDPFIGPAGLVAGRGSSREYYVAVTSATTFADVLNSAQTRLEPIDSLKRIVEERIDQGQDMDRGSSTDSTTEIEAAARLTLTPDEYKLSDVVTYMGTNGGLYMIDPFTGNAVLVRSYGSPSTFPNNCGVELRDNGKLYTIHVPNGGPTPAVYDEINQAQVNNAVSSISTEIMGKWYWLDGTNVVWENSTYQPVTMATSNWGTNMSGGAFGTQGYTLSIGNVSNFSRPLYDNQTNVISGYTRNVMFLHSANGVGVSRNRDSGQYEPATAGTNQACSTTLPLVQFSTDNGLRSNSETITSMCQGNDGSYYVVTDAGNLYRMNNPLSQGWALSTNYHVVGDSVVEVPAMRRIIGAGASLTFLGTCRNDAGTPLNLTGVDAGPRNVENGAYANQLFLTATDNKLRAVDTRVLNEQRPVEYSPCFVGGNTSVGIPAGSTSVTFSTFDYNLWHRTSKENDPVQPSTTSSLVRSGYAEGYPTSSSASWYFGLEDPRPTNIGRDTQPGALTYDGRYLTGNEESYNTYNVPGGAYGSLTSNSFSLDGYSPEDKPVLYFTYKTDSDSTGYGGNDFPGVFVSVDGGLWEPLAVGNYYSPPPDGITGGSYWNSTNEAQYNRNLWTYRDNLSYAEGGHYIDILEDADRWGLLYDEAGDPWRQARVDLSQFAGSDDLRLKFVFSTANGDIGIGTTSLTGDSYGNRYADVNGSIITAPTAHILLDGRSGTAAVPGDGSMTYDSNSYYSIGNKIFRFVDGYNLYVPATPGAYGDVLSMTINGVTVNVPIKATDSAEDLMSRIISTVNGSQIRDNFRMVVPAVLGDYSSPAYGNELILTIQGTQVRVPINTSVDSSTDVMNRIISLVNAAGIKNSNGDTITVEPYLDALGDSSSLMLSFNNVESLSGTLPDFSIRGSNFVTVKRFLDEYGKASGQMLSFENVETFTNADGSAWTPVRNFVLMGGPQDRTLENIFAMNTAQLRDFVSQTTIPVPFRADMTQAQIAGSITFMTNLVFNDLLWAELDQVEESDAAIPLIRDLLRDITNMNTATDNIIDIIDVYLLPTHPLMLTGSTKAISWVETLRENLNKDGRDAAVLVFRMELNRLYNESADLAITALNNLRATVTLSDEQAGFYNTALNSLNTTRTWDTAGQNGAGQILILQTLQAAITGDGDNEVAIRNGVASIIAMLRDYYSLHQITRLEAFVTQHTAANSTIPNNIFREIQVVMDQINNPATQTEYWQLVISRLTTMRNNIDRVGFRAPQEVLNLITAAQNDIQADWKNMIVILNQLLNDIPVQYSELFAPILLAPTGINSLNVLFDDLTAAGADAAILIEITNTINLITADPGSVPASLQRLVDMITVMPDATAGRDVALARVAAMQAAFNAAYNGTMVIAINSVQDILGPVTLYFQSVATIMANQLRTLTPAGANATVMNRLFNYANTIAADYTNFFMHLDDLLNEPVNGLVALGNANAVNAVRNLMTRAEQYFSGDHVAADLDSQLTTLQSAARSTAMTSLNSLLAELSAHVTRNAVQTINHVLKTNLTSSDPRYLINQFYYDGQLLEKILRLDTSTTNNGGSTTLSTTYLNGVPYLIDPATGLSLTDPNTGENIYANSVTMSLVSSTWNASVNRRSGLVVTYAGPLRVQTTALAGTGAGSLRDGTLNTASTGAIGRSVDNQNSGFYIDNIIVGFASRGEMVTNAPANTDFNFTAREEAFVRDGSYQLEIRRGTEYAFYQSPYVTSGATTNNAQLWNLFEVNERQTNGISFFAPSSSQVSHYQKFSISDGATTLTFVFINTKFGGNVGDAIKIEFSDGDSKVVMANKIRDAINKAFKDGLFKVTATTGSQSNSTSHFQIDLFGATDFRNLTLDDAGALASPIKHVFYGVPQERQNQDDGTITGNNGYEVVMHYDKLYMLNLNTVYSRLLSTGERDITLKINDTPITIRMSPNASALELMQLMNTVVSRINAIDDGRGNFVRATFDLNTRYLYFENVAQLLVNVSTHDNDIVWNPVVPYRTVSFLDPANKASRLYIDPQLMTRTGDGNTERQKGQLNIYGNSITHTLNYAITIAPGDVPVAVARQQSDFRPSSASRLIPGIAITNNVLAYNRGGGISLEGLADAMPFVKILNNTIYGDILAVGTGISIGSNTAPTIMNNILANLNTGIALNGTNTEAVYRANTYCGNLDVFGNVSNGEGTSANDLAQLLAANEPLFVNEARGNFYPASGSKIIDSATERLEERRQWYIDAIASLKIPESALLAPEYDMYGQARSYDKESTSGGTGGENPAYDRGAIDRVDFSKPGAVLANPEFKDPANQGTNPNDVFIIGQYFSQFSIQLSDEGTGVDPLSVANQYGFIYTHIVTIVEKIWTGTQWEEKELVLGTDYFANYNAATCLITLTPSRGMWSSEATYVITLNNGANGICDHAGNLLEANRPDDTTVFTITMTGYTFGDAPAVYGEASHVVTPGYHLGEGVAVQRSANPSARADSNPYDDGVLLDSSKSALIAGMTNQIGVKITVSDEVLLAAGDNDVIGYLSMWFDWDGDGQFSDAERIQKPITKALLVAADSNGYVWVDVNIPEKTLIPDDMESGEVFARFRFSSERIDLPSGLAKDGEVEDYLLPLMKQLHLPSGNVLQRSIEGYNERTGQYDILMDDYCLVAGESNKARATISNTTTKPAYLYAWILVNDTWIQVLGTNNTGHRINGLGLNVREEILLNLPAGIEPGEYKIRFRLTTDTTLTATGIASDGEFVDYMIDVVADRRNFGTAPGNIASHIVKRDSQKLYFGTTVIAGCNTATANAKNYQDFVDNYPPSVTKNDGVRDYQFVAGGTSWIDVVVTNTTTQDAYLSIWVDMNISGSFDDVLAKQILTDYVVKAGTAAGTVIRIDVTIPDYNPDIFRAPIMRMRLSDQKGVGATGSTVPVNGKDVNVYGEVEDWLVTVVGKNSGATIDGNIFHDLNGTGEYGTVNVEVPKPNVTSQKGATVPFVTGSELNYRSFTNAPGISSYPTYLPGLMTVEIGGRTFDSFIATDKGAIMLMNYMDYYGTYDPYTGQIVYPNVGVPSLYSGLNPTFAPFLSNMITGAQVTYSYGTDADGLDYLKVIWTIKTGVDDSGKDVFGDFGVLITDVPATGDEDAGEQGGDLVTYFYSVEFLDWVNAVQTFSTVQIGTNFGNATLNTNNPGARQYFTTKVQLMSYLDSLRYAIVPSSSNNLPSSQYTGVIPKTGKINEKPTLTGVSEDEFNLIRALYPDLNISGNMSDYNIIEITATESGLRDAIAQAGRTSENDLIVVRILGDTFIDFGKQTLKIDIDADLYGSVNIVAIGNGILQLQSSAKTGIVQVDGGDVALGGVILCGVENTKSEVASVFDLIKAGSGTNVRTSGVINITEHSNAAGNYSIFGDAASSSTPLPGTGSPINQMDSRLKSYSVTFSVGGTFEAYLTGLTQAEVTAIVANSMTANAANFLNLVQPYDAEKDGIRDTMLCWAASSANMLAYTGWGHINGFETEDDIFDYFRQNFSDDGSSQFYGNEWFITGDYQMQGQFGWSQLLALNSGGLFKDFIYNYDAIAGYYPFDGVSDITAAVNWLKAGSAIGLAVGWYDDAHTRMGGHAITMWGAIYDRAMSPTADDYYVALLISDSDDNFGGGLNAPDKLQLLYTVWDTDYDQYAAIFDAYDGAYGYLEGFAQLAQYFEPQYKASTFRLNPEQGNTIVDAILTDDVPEQVVIPDSFYEYYVPISYQTATPRATAIQSFGFWFEFGGQRYNSYVIYDNGTIGLINAQGVADASISLGMSYVSTTPTVDLLKTDGAVQIRWTYTTGIMGMIIKEDVAGDIVSFFYTENTYAASGVDLGGPTTSTSTHVFTDVGSAFVGFQYADGSTVNMVQSVLGQTYINGRQDYNDFVKKINGQTSYRMNVTTGQVYYYEPGLSGVKVELLDKNGEVIATTTTDSSGYYHFDNIFPGVYTIRHDTSTIPGSGWTPPASNTITVTIELDENGKPKDDLGNDFGYSKKGSVSILDSTVVKDSSGKTYAEIEVILDGSVGAPVTVDYVTRDGSAVNGKDYYNTANSVTVHPQMAALGQWNVKTAVANAPSATYRESISGNFIAYTVTENNQEKIRIYNVVTGQTFNLTEEIGHRSGDKNPTILHQDGKLRIVWSSYDPILKTNQIFYAEAPDNDLSQLTRPLFADAGSSQAILPVSSLLAETSIGENTAPQISSYEDNGRVVYTITWMCKTKDGRTEIYCIDSIDAVIQKLPDNIKRVTNNNAVKTNVLIEGKNIVWIETNSFDGRESLMLYTIGSSTSPINLPSKIGLDGQSSTPVMSGNYIAWVQTRSLVDKSQKIVYYDIEAGKSYDIDYGYFNYQNYYAEFMVWVDHNRDNLDNMTDPNGYIDNVPIFGRLHISYVLDYYDIIESWYGETTYDAYRNGSKPSMDGDWIVWQEPRSVGGKTDILAYNIKTKVLKNLTTYNPDTDESPQVVGNLVVWRSMYAEGYGDKAQWHVRFYDLSIDGFIPQTISASNTIDFEPMITDTGMIVWRSQHNTSGLVSIKVATREAVEPTATIQIEILSDSTSSGDKEFSVILTGVKEGPADLSNDTEAVVTIIDNSGIGQGLSYGSAPASYDTLPKDDGARHIITNALNSKGQSVPIGFDSNGVKFQGDWVPGTRVCILVYATTDSTLNMWMDWNANGRFGNKSTGTADTGEHVTLYGSQTATLGGQAFQLKEGVNEIWLDIPTYAKLGQSYARFRITSEANTPADMKWFGLAKDGAVKDYAVNVVKGNSDPSNLIYVQGDTLVIKGSAMVNTIVVTREASRIVVDYNGTQQTFSTSSNAIREVKVDGYTGRDNVTVKGLASEQYLVEMDPFNAVITSNSLKISVSNVSNISYVGSALDTVEMRDSTGDDTAVIGPNSGTMEGPGRNFVNTVSGVSQITVYSVRGGNDKLTLNGSTKADQFMSWMNSVTMSDVGVFQTGGEVKHAWFNRAFGFTDVTVNAVVDPNKKELDVATIVERTAGSANLTADPESARLVRSNTKPEQALNLTLNGFNTVAVTAQESARLSAYLSGNAGIDALVASDTQAKLSGKRADGMAYSIQVNLFASCVVDAGAGNDTASYASGSGGEHLTVMNDQKTVELFANVNSMDEALLKLIAFESVKFDSAKNKCSADIASINKALIDIDLVGDWVDRNH